VKEEESVSSSRFDLIYERLVPHLDRPEKKGLFLLGVLTQLLLDVQKEIRQAQPFRDKLKGLRMREGEFKGLVPLIKDKLWQYESDLRYKDYDRFYAAVLFEEISTLLELSGDNWKLSVDEMNFHFVSGMSMKFKVLNLLNELKSK
jgi:CRISPR-associated protein Csh1